MESMAVARSRSVTEVEFIGDVPHEFVIEQRRNPCTGAIPCQAKSHSQVGVADGIQVVYIFPLNAWVLRLLSAISTLSTTSQTDSGITTTIPARVVSEVVVLTTLFVIAARTLSLRIASVLLAGSIVVMPPRSTFHADRYTVLAARYTVHAERYTVHEERYTVH